MTDSVTADPEPASLATMPGAVLIEFGATWCGYCRTAQPLIAAALARFPQVRHIRIEDGKGKRLGRLYRVKLWPTLVLLQAGVELAREVRPQRVEAIIDLLAASESGGGRA